jgi:8-oxo-dGTP diphosphatase
MGKPYSLAVRAVLADEAGQCLLVRRSGTCGHFTGAWEWPGGKLDAGEDFASAIAREVREEVGLDVELTGLAGATEFEMEKLHVVVLCMTARAQGGELRLSDEHDAFAWVPFADFSEYAFPGPMRRFMQAYARQRC